MTCEKASNRYLALDKLERVPLSVTLHLLVCPSCRTSVRRLTRAQSLLASAFTSNTETVDDDPSVAAAVARIQASCFAYPVDCPSEPKISLYRWMVSGVALVAGFAIIPFSSIGEWSRAVFGSAYSIPFYLLCGVAVTVYCGLFVGTNIDFFVKKFGIEHNA